MIHALSEISSTMAFTDVGIVTSTVAVLRSQIIGKRFSKEYHSRDHLFHRLNSPKELLKLMLIIVIKL